MKKFILPALVAVSLGLSIYSIVYSGKIRNNQAEAVVTQPVLVEPAKPQAPPPERLVELAGYDYAENLFIGNKLHIDPIVAVSHNRLGKDIGDIWYDAVNSALRFNDGNSAAGVQFVFSPFSSDPVASIYKETINLSSANILAGDSVMLLPAIANVKTLPLLIHAFYDDGTTYTHSDTDTTFIYTYSNSLPVKVAYILDAFIEGIHDDNTFVTMAEDSSDIASPYWIDLKNFNTGTGTIDLNIYYLKN